MSSPPTSILSEGVTPKNSGHNSGVEQSKGGEHAVELLTRTSAKSKVRYARRRLPGLLGASIFQKVSGLIWRRFWVVEVEKSSRLVIVPAIVEGVPADALFPRTIERSKDGRTA
jgi:hypothetical protein